MNPGQKCYFWDFNSLYPSVSSDPSKPFPIGKPVILIKPDDLKKLHFEKGVAYYIINGADVHVKGLAQVKILCPPMDIPFLQYRYTVYFRLYV